MEKVKASEGLYFCNQLYSIEKKLKHVNPTERHEQRLKQSRPILDLFSIWHQWNHFEAFLLDGRLEVANNRSERSIKPFVIGRKNWMFSNTTRGARGNAIMYSVLETEKENNLSPYHYHRYLFETLSKIDLNNKEEINKVLRW